MTKARGIFHHKISPGDIPENHYAGPTWDLSRFEGNHMKNLLDPGTKCLLVQSKFSDFSFWNYADVCRIAGAKYPAPPLGLLTVAALLPQQWHFKLVDANVEALLDEHLQWADVVCTSGMLPQQQALLALIDRAHGFDLPVVVGGPDPTSQPHLYRTADYLVCGEGEITIPMFVSDLATGAGKGEYRSDLRADMSRAVVPRFDLIRFRDYLQMGIQYSRGCPFHCEFCDITELYGRASRTKTAEHVLSELQSLHDLGYRGHVDFVDDNFIGDKRNVRMLLPAIQEWSEAHGYPFYFSTEASINLAEDEPLLEKMKQADFRFVFIGLETPENDVLKGIKKRQNVNKPIAEVVRKINSFGMTVNAGFIIGMDGEGDGTAESLIDCIQDSGICMAMLGKLCALPNTQLTARLRREGRLLEDDLRMTDEENEFDQTTCGLNFLTERPRLEILQDYRRVLTHIYEPRNYYQRIMRTGRNLRPRGKHKHSFSTKVNMAVSFLRLVRQAGLNRATGPLFWKMLATMLVRNTRALETSTNLAAMYVHFRRQSQFVLEQTRMEIEKIQSFGERPEAVAD